MGVYLMCPFILDGLVSVRVTLVLPVLVTAMDGTLLGAVVRDQVNCLTHTHTHTHTHTLGATYVCLMGILTH